MPAPSYAQDPESTSAAVKPPKQDLQTRIVMKSISMGTSSARGSLNMIAKNQGAMGELHKLGLAGVVKGVNEQVNPAKVAKDKERQADRDEKERKRQEGLVSGKVRGGGDAAECGGAREKR